MVDQAVLSALLGIAIEAVSDEIGASVRQLAKISLWGKNAVWKSLRRLGNDSIIRQTSQARGDKPARFKVNLQNSKIRDIPSHFVAKGVSPLLGKAEREQALLSYGRAAHQIYLTLQRCGPFTTQELALATGRCYETTRQTLNKFAERVSLKTGEIVTLAEKVKGKWRAIEGVNLDEVAELFGTDKKRDEMMERHDEEREARWRRLNL
jgi:hypothetical protein